MEQLRMSSITNEDQHSPRLLRGAFKIKNRQNYVNFPNRGGVVKNAGR